MFCSAAVALRQAPSFSNSASSSGDSAEASSLAVPAPAVRRGGRARLGNLGVAAQPDLALAAQHLRARLGQPQRLVLALHGEQALGEQLADDGTPLGILELGADAERLQLMVGLLGDLLGLLAEQDVDDLPGAVALVPLALQPHDRGQELLRRRPCHPRPAAGTGRCRSYHRRWRARRSRPAAGCGGSRLSRTAPAWRPGGFAGGAGAPGFPRWCRSSGAAAPRRPARRQAMRWPAARRAPRAPSPGSSPPPSAAGPGGRRSGRRACRSPCRTRSSRR